MIVQIIREDGSHISQRFGSIATGCDKGWDQGGEDAHHEGENKNADKLRPINDGGEAIETIKFCREGIEMKPVGEKIEDVLSVENDDVAKA